MNEMPKESAYRWFSVVNGRLGDLVLKAPTREEACTQADRMGRGAYVYGEYSGESNWFQVWERAYGDFFKGEWVQVEEGVNLPFQPVRPFETAEN